MGQPGQGLLIIERILRDRDGIWRQVSAERDLKPLTVRMLASSAISLACYGAVLGASKSPAQALSSTIKLPLLFLATLAICLPTLYLFNLIFGARLSVMQAVALIMVSITVTSVLTLAFAPISLFFLISAHSYSFFKLLNVAILVLAAVVGLRFLTSGMAALNAYQQQAAVVREEPASSMAAQIPAQQVPALVGAPGEANGIVSDAPAPAPASVPAPRSVPGPASGPVSAPGPVARAGAVRGPVPAEQAGARPASMALLYIWIGLFGFVGTQLGWTLRPFFGSPNEPFQVFRDLDGTFYGDVFATIGRLLAG